MATTIYYFSGTGNSLKLAQDLAEGIADCELVPISKYYKQSSVAVSSENVGFVFPVYFWGLPDLVIDFIKKLDVEKGSYFFAVASRGGSPSYSMSHINRMLKKKGKRLSMSMNINMPSNYVVSSYYEKIYANDKKQQKLFSNAVLQIEQAVKSINKKERALSQHNWITRPLVWFVNLLFTSIASNTKADKKFYASDSCNVCTVCQEICPVNNIALMEKKPQWHHTCQQCMACIQYCPQKAINYKKDCSARPRYHQPQISAKDIARQSS